MKLFPAKCHERATLLKLWRQTGNSSLLPAKCWPFLHVIAGISARFSKFALVLFCHITNHLMTGPLGNNEFCFPWISMFPSTSSRETLRFSENKIHCSPRDQSLSVNYRNLHIVTVNTESVLYCFYKIILKIRRNLKRRNRVYVLSSKQTYESVRSSSVILY